MTNKTKAVSTHGLETICTDFETSKRLKELGVESETRFCWVKLSHSDTWFLQFWMSGFMRHDTYPDNFIAAYTLEQLMDMIPAGFKKNHPKHGEQNMATATARFLIKLGIVDSYYKRVLGKEK